MEIALMSSTKGLGNTLWNINLMEFITDTANKYIAKFKCLQKASGGLKKIFTTIEGKSQKLNKWNSSEFG